MSSVIIPRRHLVQPQGQADIAAEYAENLARLFYAPNITGGWTASGASNIEPYHAGLAFVSGNPARYDRTLTGNQNTGFSIALYMDVMVAGGGIDYAGFFDGGTYRAMLYITGASQIAFYPRNGFGVIAHTKTLQVGDRISICATATGTTYYVETTVNGSTQVVAGTYSGTGTYNNATVGQKFSGSGSSRNKTSHAAFWDRSIAPALAAKLARDPWRLFRSSSRRLYFDVGGASALTPGSGTLEFVGNAPDIDQPRSLTPGSGTLTLTGNAPVVSQPRTLTPGSATLTLTGNAPTINQPRSLTPGSGTLTLNGNAPEIAAPSTVTPGSGTLEFVGNAPDIDQPRSLTPGSGTLSITGNAPTITNGAGALTPGSGTLMLTGNAPDIDQPRSLTPGSATLSLTGNAPTISNTPPPVFEVTRVPTVQRKTRKRAIPAPTAQQVAINVAVKERLEIISGERVPPLTDLPATASTEEVVSKINELLARLQ
jgi:hypothetical protein